MRRVATLVVALAAMLAAPQAASAAGPAFSTSSVPNPNKNSELYSDTCSSRSDCWAVGFYVNGAGANIGEALHFKGKGWSRVSAPEPGGVGATDYDYLDAVSCPSRSDCWAVGYYGNRAKAAVNEILRWNGRKWTKVHAPQPAGTAAKSERNQLYGIACPAAADCWAVGFHTNKAGAYLNEALHWNGKGWKTVAAPNPEGTATGRRNVSYGVSCSSRSNCVSVGYGLNRSGAYLNQALRWNGKRWVTLSTPQPSGRRSHGYAYLQGVTCLSASDCWADGGYQNASDAYLNEALQWNGKTWAKVATPNPSGTNGGSDNELAGLSCAAPSDCWAVGYYYSNTAAQLNEALHWDGAAWSLVSTPQPGGTASNHNNNALYGLSCASDSDCWAVGYTFDSRGRSQNEALWWDGIAWSAG